MGRGLSDLQQRIVAEVKKRSGLTYREAYKLFGVKISPAKDKNDYYRRYKRQVTNEQDKIRHVMNRLVKRGLFKKWYRPLENINIHYDDFRNQKVPSGVEWVNVPVPSIKTHNLNVRTSVGQTHKSKRSAGKR